MQSTSSSNMNLVFMVRAQSKPYSSYSGWSETSESNWYEGMTESALKKAHCPECNMEWGTEGCDISSIFLQNAPKSQPLHSYINHNSSGPVFCAKKSCRQPAYQAIHLLSPMHRSRWCCSDCNSSTQIQSKSFYSVKHQSHCVKLQACVEPDEICIDFCLGWFGSIHDK